ncbi:hypothetical protein IWW48_000657 [Coemansia sp. RSA 1200]|nr:hypothetical protein IWW48_000657 [Coemansia sp. RSA 1200]
MDANVDDLEDEDYVPGSPGEFADEETQQTADNIHVDINTSQRQGIRAKSAHDDPFRKKIWIKPRTAMESENDDGVVQSILMSWKLGVIDIRRVYFCDDELEQSEASLSDDGDLRMDLGGDSDGRDASAASNAQLDSNYRIPFGMEEDIRHNVSSGRGNISNDRLETHNSEGPRVPFNSSSSQLVLRSFRSGTQFGYRMWISNGGLRRVMKRLCGFLESEQAQLEHMSTITDASTAAKQHPDQSATSYNYGDILRIDISATPQEFVQAYTTLLILWYEALSLTGQSEGQARELSDSVEADVLRWIEFTQQYMLATMRSKSALAQLVVSIVECTSDGIAKLEQLDTKEEYNLVGAAYIGFSFAVALLQLAFAIAGVRGNSGLAGPRAVGEDDELPIEWEPERFGPEIDKCLQVIIRLLSIGLQRHDPFRLGNAEQIWVALLHIFSSGSQGTGSLNKDKHGYGEAKSYYDKGSVADTLTIAGSTIVHVSGVWPAVQRACKGQGSGDFQYSDSLWAAFAYILPLSQVSDEGIAAPRTASQWRPHLASMADTAVEKQLAVCLKHSAGQKQLRASNEALVRQAFVRIHSAVVDHGITFGPNSHVYISMYRYLESNSFRSLSIEPLPSLPRFFTRYCGSIKRESSPSDTCTMLWLKAFDISLSEWNRQLGTIQPTSKPHRHLLRSVRSAVSKMLPTRILTFDSSESRAQLSTLANYYAVFLFFLHAMPSGVVRCVRLYTQFQALLRFKESANLVARRVYFEAWSAAIMIIARSLRQILESSGHVGLLVEQLVGKSAVSADARDFYDALAMAVNSWGESVSTIIGDCFADDQRVGKTARSDMSWSLADVAFMYLQRVLASDALARHAPTMLILVHSVLSQSFLIDVVTNSADGFGNSNNTATTNYNQSAGDKGASFSLNAAILERLIEIVRVWQDTVLGRHYGGDKNDTNSNRGETREEKSSSRNVSAMATVAIASPPEREDNSQAAFAAFDSTELLEVTAEIEEVERQASFAAVNMAILQLVHEKYIPALRLRIIAAFTSLSVNSRATQLARVPSQHQARALVATVFVLAPMVSSCVDAGMRAWESFFEEHGRESLYLVPDRRGRRLVLVLFALATVNVLRYKGQSTQRLDVALKDLWFACACDLELLPYTHRLAAALWFKDTVDKRMACGGECPLAVFASAPVDRRLADSRGMVDDRHLAARMRSAETEDARTAGIEAYEDKAALALSLIDGVLQEIGRSTRGSTTPLHTRQVLSSWVGKLVDTARAIKVESEQLQYGIVDTREVVGDMAERVALLVRNNCADLLQSMNISP